MLKEFKEFAVRPLHVGGKGGVKRGRKMFAADTQYR